MHCPRLDHFVRLNRDGTVGKNFIIDQIIKLFGNGQTAVSDYIRHCALRFGRQPEKMFGQRRYG